MIGAERSAMINIERVVDDYLLETDKKRREEHIASGYLSAGRLDKSILENALYLLGVPRDKPIEAYTLKKFARGNQVEQWYIDIFTELGLIADSQIYHEYITPEGFKVIGYQDIQLKEDEYPIEVKSIKNSEFKHIEKEGVKKGHALQVATYALAKGVEFGKVLYAAADDLRTKEFLVNAKELQPEIDNIAKLTYSVLNSKKLPKFIPRNSFQSLLIFKDYTDYPEWIAPNENYLQTVVEKEYIGKGGTVYKRKFTNYVLKKPYEQDYLMDKLKNEHPSAYNKLMEGDEKWQTE